MTDETWSIGLEVGVEKGALFSVWGPAPDEVYVVGGQGQGAESTGVMLAWDGAAWSEVALPPGTRRLHWIAGVGAEVWAVGEAGAALRREGDAWAPVTTGVDVSLWGIWGADAGTIWAVGGDGFTGPGIMLRWDGSAWGPETLPELPPECHALFKIWGKGADEVTAVGDFGVALRRTGGAWALQDMGSIADLIGVSGSTDTVVAVGGRANSRISRWDGSAWTGATLAFPGLSGVWVDADGTATAVGSQGLILQVPAGGVEATQVESPTFLVLHSVFGFTGGPFFAVGGNLIGAPPYIGVIVQRP